MSKVTALISLTRPVNAIICGLSVIAGGSLGGYPFDRLGRLSMTLLTRGAWNLSDWQWRTLLAALSATLILAAGNVLNDVCDVATDRINTPYRPLPSGTVSTTGALLFAAILALSGICLALPLGIELTMIAVFATLLLVWYDTQLKRIPLAGNCAVALLGGFAFIYGGIAGYGMQQSLIPAVFAFLLHLGRELIKDGADVQGDSATGVSTIATRYSIRTAAIMASVVLAILAAAVIIPAVIGLFGWEYSTIITLFVLPIIVWCAISALRQSTPSNLRRIAIILKADMPVGIIAVLIGFQKM